MKKLLLHLVVLAALVLAACNFRNPSDRAQVSSTPNAPRQSLIASTQQADAVPSTTPPSASDWRRTSNGWERRSSWQVEPPKRTIWSDIMSVHPLVWATLQVLLSIGALICFESEDKSLANAVRTDKEQTDAAQTDKVSRAA